MMSAWGGQAEAHTRMKPNEQIVPRSNRDNAKTGPCGGDAKTTPKVFLPGAQVRIDWEETINHPGRYEIRFSPDGVDFSTVLANETDTQNGVDDLPHSYHKTVTLPNTPCLECVVQLVQVMTDRNPPTNYYTCADVRIDASSPANNATPIPTVQPTTTPVPGPSDLRLEWRKEGT